MTLIQEQELKETTTEIFVTSWIHRALETKIQQLKDLVASQISKKQQQQASKQKKAPKGQKRKRNESPNQRDPRTRQNRKVEKQKFVNAIHSEIDKFLMRGDVIEEDRLIYIARVVQNSISAFDELQQNSDSDSFQAPDAASPVATFDTNAIVVTPTNRPRPVTSELDRMLKLNDLKALLDELMDKTKKNMHVPRWSGHTIVASPSLCNSEMEFLQEAVNTE